MVACVQSVQAMEPMMPLADAPAMVLTPARLSQPQSEAPASVTVIDRNLIEASGARERLHQLIVENLSDVRRRASRSTLPPRAVTLADTLAAAVEERIP